MVDALRSLPLDLYQHYDEDALGCAVDSSVESFFTRTYEHEEKQTDTHPCEIGTQEETTENLSID